MNDLTLNLSKDPSDHVSKLQHRLMAIKCPNCEIAPKFYHDKMDSVPFIRYCGHPDAKALISDVLLGFTIDCEAVVPDHLLALEVSDNQ